MSKRESSNLYRKDLRKRIQKAALQSFQEKGIKAVKMDDISTRLSISKRTLYEIYGNKETLLFECFRVYYEEVSAHMESFNKSGKNVLQMLIEFYRVQVRTFSNKTPLFFSDLQKYPQVVAYLEKRRAEQKVNSLAFFQQGIREGYFRDDVNYEIVTRIADVGMRYVMESQMYNDFPLHDIFRNYLFVLVRGFCTEKGLLEFEHHLSLLK